MATSSRNSIQTKPRKFKRTSNACIACRTSKIKCTGEQPCANCVRRRVECRFLESVNKVMVPERYLRELQGKAWTGRSNTSHPSLNVQPAREMRDREKRATVKRTSTSAFSDDGNMQSPGRVDPDSLDSQPDEIPQGLDSGRTIWTSPFTLPSRIIKKNHKSKRNWTWLAPASAWSFTARLKLMIAEKLNVEAHHSGPELFDGDMYPINWNPAPVNEDPDISNLPSIDHASYLFNTVKFHFGHNFRLIDETEFMEHLHEFYYGDPTREAKEARLWFVQFLLVLAFGNAFLFQSRGSPDPPGGKFFVRAMSLMPDHTSLSRGGFTAIEDLALIGLYLYSIDHRSSAHVYTGHAVRLAQMDGMHTQLPEDELGPETVARCRNLWWTLYVLDRHISSSVGASMTPHDSDITTLLDPPTACSPSDATLSLSVRLSHLLSYIYSSIYKGAETQLGTFLETTRSILHVLASHAREIESIIHYKFKNSVDTMPKGTRHITLLYHQCVVVATRPLLLSVLKERLQKLDHGAEDWQSIVAPTNALISAGIKSAAKTLQILTDEDSLLEVFLPFDMEFTYGAAMHVTMAGALFPNVTEGQGYIKDAYSILDQMTQRGNKLAAARKSELVSLEKLFQELALRIETRGLEALILPTVAQSETSAVGTDMVHMNNHNMRFGDLQQQGGIDDAGIPVSGPDPLPPLSTSMSCDPGTPSILAQAPDMDFLDSIGISSYEFLSLVNQIGNTEGLGLGPFTGVGEGDGDGDGDGNSVWAASI
ncbi:hypothetical protein BDV18DRAFT_152711 [Aspergillus unguis]